MVPSAHRAHGCQDPGATAGVPASGAVTPSRTDVGVDGPVTRSASRSQSAPTVAVSGRAVKRCEIDIKPLGIGALRTDGRASFPRSTLYLEVDNQSPIGSCRVFARRERDPVTALAPAGVVAKEPSCTLSGNTKNQVKEYASGSSGLQNLGSGYYQLNWKAPANTPTAARRSSSTWARGAGRGRRASPSRNSA